MELEREPSSSFSAKFSDGLSSSNNVVPPVLTVHPPSYTSHTPSYASLFIDFFYRPTPVRSSSPTGKRKEPII